MTHTIKPIPDKEAVALCKLAAGNYLGNITLNNVSYRAYIYVRGSFIHIMWLHGFPDHLIRVEKTEPYATNTKVRNIVNVEITNIDFQEV